MIAYSVRLPKVDKDPLWGDDAFIVVANNIATVARRYPTASHITKKSEKVVVIGKEKK